MSPGVQESSKWTKNPCGTPEKKFMYVELVGKSKIYLFLPSSIYFEKKTPENISVLIFSIGRNFKV